MGEGWGEGEPPFVLSRQKDPSPLVGEGWGEGVTPTHRTFYIRFRSKVVGRVYEYDLRMRTYSEN